jgi:uncharacterized membrane protein YphA (DoxX/SURF4 family)
MRPLRIKAFLCRWGVSPSIDGHKKKTIDSTGRIEWTRRKSLEALSMSKPVLPPAATAALIAVRVLVGWHFLYEGLAKLFTPGWSSAAYLAESSWIMSGAFHAIIRHPAALRTVDILNMWGLVLIGLGLFLGVCTRTAAVSGMGMLLLYYVAQPPLLGLGSITAEGSYLVVNKILIELAVLLVFVLLPKGTVPGLETLLSRLRRGGTTEVVPATASIALEENHADASFAGLLKRRELLQALAAIPVFGGFAFAVLKKRSYEEQQLAATKGVHAVTSASMKAARFAGLSELAGQVQKGRIGNIDIGRIIVGGNLVSGFAHSRDLIYVSPLLRTYFTDEKIMETLRLCEACGINTAILRTDEDTIRILRNYWKRGGKIQWLAQVYPKTEDIYTNPKRAIDNGAIGAFVMGGIADQWVKDNRFDLLAKSVEFIKQNRVIAGTACHSALVPALCEKANLGLDFYMKTFHSDEYWSAHPKVNRPEFSTIGSNQKSHDQFHDNMWCTDPGETVEVMSKISKPWIAYKVLAAGAIHPKEAFAHAFGNGADFACVGMFDFQVVENANIAYKLLAGGVQRDRTWYA